MENFKKDSKEDFEKNNQNSIGYLAMRRKYKTDNVKIECIVADEKQGAFFGKRIIVHIIQNGQIQTISSIVPSEIIKGTFTDGSLSKTLFGYFIKD